MVEDGGLATGGVGGAPVEGDGALQDTAVGGARLVEGAVLADHQVDHVPHQVCKCPNHRSASPLMGRLVKTPDLGPIYVVLHCRVKYHS